ncbi:MAG: TRAP transporter small permease [Congregibacter sp.]
MAALVPCVTRVVRAIRAAVSALVFLFFAYMLVAVLVQVLGRYFAFSIDWAAETATLAQVWMVLLAAGLAMRDRLHVRVDALLNLLPPSLISLITVLVTIACLWFLSLTIEGSLALIGVGRIESSPVLGLPMWIAYLCLPLGLSYFALELVLALGTRWLEPDTDLVEKKTSG